MTFKPILINLITLLIMCQFLVGDTYVKENNFTGWKIPDLSCFKVKSAKKIKPKNELPEVTVEHYYLKDKTIYYLVNKKISSDSRQAELSEKIESFTRELINSFDIISSIGEENLRIFKIYSISQSDAQSYYQTQMKIKKSRFGIDGGIDSGGASSYFILDYDNDGIFETRIWCDIRENSDSEKEFYLILKDYVDNRKVKHDQCFSRIMNLKKNWLNFLECPTNNTLKILYESFPEKKIDTWLEKLEQENREVNEDNIFEKSKYLLKSLEEWQEQSLFCEGRAKKEEKLLLEHISKNLHLILREFIYGNPYAIGIALKLYPILMNDKAFELDNMLVLFCLAQPERFLEGLKQHSQLIKVDQALDRTIGLENIGFLQNAKREIRILLETIQKVKNKDLINIKEECIKYLVRRLEDLDNTNNCN